MAFDLERQEMIYVANAKAFRDWLNSAAIGETVVYHEGFLLLDRVTNLAAAALGNVVWSAHLPRLGKRRVVLIQERASKSTWIYKATRVE